MHEAEDRIATLLLLALRWCRRGVSLSGIRPSGLTLVRTRTAAQTVRGKPVVRTRDEYEHEE